MTVTLPAADTACVFPLLAEPATYNACTFDLGHDPTHRDYWIGHFRGHFPLLLGNAIEVELAERHAEEGVRHRAGACLAAFLQYLDEVASDPDRHGRLNILAIGTKREKLLREHGFADPYRLVKQRENAAALRLLPVLLAELDALPRQPREGWQERETRLIQGIFAGNIFDLGAMATLKLFESGQMDFSATRAGLKPRPWRMDHLDAWLARLQHGRTHRAAVLFADNAGCDVVLGIIPFARALLERGTQVILAANAAPSLNDITAGELAELIETIAATDAVIADAVAAGRLEVIASGCITPLIDLSRVSCELAEAVQRRGVDLVVLEGMGRAVESNLHVRMTCDVMNLALIKDAQVARDLNGQMYDQVMRFVPGGA